MRNSCAMWKKNVFEAESARRQVTSSYAKSSAKMLSTICPRQLLGLLLSSTSSTIPKYVCVFAEEGHGKSVSGI